MRRAACLAALVVSFAAILPAAPRSAFTLGVLRRDGILLPFASLNGHDWSIPWPDSDSSVAVPIGLDDVPKKWWGPIKPASPWTAWIIADAAERPLKIQKPAQVRVFCESRIGLRTDYQGAPVDSRAPGIAKDGLAVASDSGAVSVTPIFDVSLLSPDAKRLAASLTGEFNKQESVALADFLNWSHPYSPQERFALPIELESFYRVHETTPGGGNWLISYVEAVRRYPARLMDKGCGLITFVRGWVTEEPGKTPEFHLSANVSYCDREGVYFMLPLGHLSVDGENYWVYQMSSWRDEIYTVARMRPEEVRPVVSVFGGGCPK